MASYDKFFEPETECAPQEVLRWTQSRRLVRLVELAYTNVPFYRRKLDEAGVVPSDIRTIFDITKLPLLEERELADSYPFGMLASSKSSIAVTERILTGTGRPYITAWSPADMETRVRCTARALLSTGAKPGDCLLIAPDSAHFASRAVIAAAAARAGISAIPVGDADAGRMPDIMRELGVDMLCCTVSQAFAFADTLVERGIEPLSLRLRALLLIAEDWSETDRASIEHILGVKAYDVYGVSKLFGAGPAAECVMQDGMHVAEDCFFPEVIDPDTLRPLPEGQYGELVLTFLCGDVLPLLRLRTGDTTCLTRFPCACGRTAVRMSRPAAGVPRKPREAAGDGEELGSGYKAAALLESIFANTGGLCEPDSGVDGAPSDGDPQ